MSAALGALSSVTAGCTAAQDKFLASDKGAELVVSLLAPSNTATTVSLTCAVVHALTMPVSARKAGKQSDHDLGVAGALPADVVALYSGATVHNMQKRLAETGALTHLVRSTENTRIGRAFCLRFKSRTLQACATVRAHALLLVNMMSV